MIAYAFPIARCPRSSYGASRSMAFQHGSQPSLPVRQPRTLSAPFPQFQRAVTITRFLWNFNRLGDDPARQCPQTDAATKPAVAAQMSRKTRLGTAQPSSSFDRIAATCAALMIVVLAAFLLVRNQPIADSRLFLVLRVVVSFGAAVLGATIPGFLELTWPGHGLLIRAGGALALFVLSFVYTPDLATGQANPGLQIRQESKGSLSPNILGKTGNIRIEGARVPQKE
jgi:hypothetical protein